MLVERIYIRQNYNLSKISSEHEAEKLVVVIVLFLHILAGALLGAYFADALFVTLTPGHLPVTETGASLLHFPAANQAGRFNDYASF